MLAAADALFADARIPGAVTMDAIAEAAGVGKGTLFRTFGNRDGLLDALWADNFATVRMATENDEPPLGRTARPGMRAASFLDALLTFKVANRHLIRARETAPQIHGSEQYKWTHGTLRSMIQQAARGFSPQQASYAAHSLLAGLNIELIDELLASGFSMEDIRRNQIDNLGRMIGERSGPRIPRGDASPRA